MKREPNWSAKGWSQVLIAALLITLCAPVAVAATWVEGSNPVFAPPAGVYYPSVLYDADAFSGHGAPYPYKLWFSNGSATAVGLAASNDGLSWTVLSSAVTGLASPHHVQVLYDAGGFGGSGYSYRIWYWCQSSSIYDIGSIHTAESADGVTWSNDQALTQFGTSVIVDNGTNWNRGSYGPIALIYNAAGSATLDDVNIFDNRYVMYYDGTTGSQEAWGLAYSVNGILWQGYNGGLTPVLPAGGPGAWDQNYATHGSVVHSRYTSSWDAWYGGGISASSEGIGHATSPDGITWTRDPDNPLTDLGCPSASSGLGCAGTWNETRNYTPVVLAWPSGNACPARDLKMWRSGRDAAGNKALGFASAVSPDVTVRHVPADYATIQAAITASNPGDTVQVAAGTFTENIILDKPIELAGAGAGITILVPALSNPNCGGAGGSDPLCAGASSVILVQSGCVSIRDLTVDGDNPSLPGGVTVNGASVDARNGIILNEPLGPFDYFTVRDCQVKNIYLRGIYAYQPSSASLKPHLSLRGNTVDNVAGSADFSIGIFSRYSTGTIEDNTVTNCPDAISANWSHGLQFLNNTVTGSGSGVHTDNAGSTSGDPADVLRGNVVSSGAAFGGYPIYGVWAFNPYSPVTIANNSVDGADIGLAVHGAALPSGVVAFSGNAVNGSARVGSRGALVSTDRLGWGSANASATFTGDRIQACAKGLEVDQQAGYASLATVTGATITGNASGILVNGGSVSVTGSDLSSNSSSGVDNAGGTATATCNWWGSASGPTTALNPGGSGSAVTGPATFAPWWTNATGPCDGTIATHLAFAVQPPASAQAGQALTPAVAVQVLDASDALCAHFNGTITLALSGGEPSAVLSGGSATVVNGVATFATLTVDQAGTSYQLTASFTGLTPALSEAFDILCGVPSVVYVDNAWSGLPNGTSVTADGGPHVIGCDAFATVQLAVNGVSDNGTIHVAAGTYTGTVNIENRHTISILGAGRDTTIFQPTSTLPWSVGNPSFDSRHTSIRVVGSTGINLSGVTIDMVHVRGELVYDLLYWNATGALDANRYVNNSPPDLSNYSFVAHVRAVSAPYSVSNRAAVSFTNSEFLDTGRVAINVHNWVYLTISGNTFRNNVTQPDTFGYAMEIGSTATGTISGNTISGYNVPANDNSESAGIYIESAFTTDLRGGPVIPKPVTVTNNEIYACQYGAWVGLGYAGLGGPVAIATSFSENRVHDIAPSVPGQPSGGLLMEDADRTYGSSNTLSASGNTFYNITGPAYRFFTAGDGELHAAVTGDVMTGCTAGFVAEEGAGATSHASVYDLAIHFCRIAGNTSAAQNLLNPAYYPTPVQAQNDWWGCNYGPGGSGAGCTSANGVSGAITVDPWFVLALGASPDMVGFGETSTLLADFFKDNHGATVVGGTIPDGTPVAFAGTLGSVVPTSATTTSGQASSTFTAGVVAGTDGASATTDGQTLTAVTVNNPAPVLTSIAPFELAPGQPDFTLTLTGTSFLPGAVVLWNGTPLPDAPSGITPTQITVTVRAASVASLGTYSVVVQNPGPPPNNGSNSVNFTVANPPVAFVNQAWAALAAGTMVSVTVPSPGNHYVGYDAFGVIQQGLDAVASGGSVVVYPATDPAYYAENLTVRKPLTLYGTDRDTTVVVPAVSNPNPCTGASLCVGASNIILVQANDVTIHDLTLDGDNPSLSAGIDLGGANVDARNGIITNHSLVPAQVFNNMTIYNTTVKNIYLRGMYASSLGTFDFHDNQVTNVQGDGYSIGMFAWGGPGIMADNTVSFCNDAISANHSKGIQFLRNVVSDGTNAGSSGVHTDNSGDGAGAVKDVIQDNQVTGCDYGVWVFVPYIAPDVTHNTTTNCVVGFGAFGGAFAPSPTVTTTFLNNTASWTGTPPATPDDSYGFWLSTGTFGYGNVNASIQLLGNAVSGYGTGIYVQPLDKALTIGTLVPSPVPAGGNTVTGNLRGLYVEALGSGGSVYVDFEKNDIHGNAAGFVNASATSVTGTCNWWGDGTGPRHPSNPTATPSNSSVSDNVTFVGWSTATPPVFNCDGCIPPDASITSADAVCSGSAGNTASAPDPIPGDHTFSWTITNGAITSSTNTASITYTAGATGPVTLGVTVTITATSCSRTDSRDVAVNPVPVATITPSGPTMFCQGGSVTLDAGVHASYLWSTGDTTRTLLVTTAGSYTVTVTDLGCTSAPSAATVVTVMATPPAITYVDDGYEGLATGTLVDWPYTGAGTHIIGCDAFATVQGGMDAVASGGTVNVAAGSYAENLLVSKPLSLLGPNTGKAGYALDRGSEAILYPASVGYDFNLPSALTILRIASPDVTVDGFKLDGDNPDLPGGISMGGANVDAASGVSNWASNSDTWGARLFRVHVQNNILTHFSYIAMELDSPQQPAGDNLVQNNLFTNLDPGVTPVYKVGIGIYTGWNLYTDIVGNHFTDVRRGVQIENNSSANPGATMVVENNEVHSWRVGIWYNLHYGSASPITIQDNRMFAEATSTSNVGLRLTSLSGSIIPTVKNNDVTGGWVGMEAWNVPTTGPILVEGGTIAGAETGVWFTNYEDTAPDGSNGYKSASNGDASLLVNDLTISGSTVRGIYVQDSPLNFNASKQVTLTANSTDVDGGASATGLLADGPKAAAAAATCAFRSGSSGVVALNGGTASVTYSDLSGNSSFGANNLNAGGTPVLAASCDWWGDASGPTNPANPPGTGTVASSYVTFAPWSTIGTAPYDCDGCVNVSITTQPLSTSVCSGSGTTLSVVAAGTGLSYQWYQGTAPDTSTPLGTASTQATGNLTVTTSYWVRVSGFCGSPVNSATATVTVNPLPVLASMTPNELAPGQPAFTMTLTGSDFDSSAVVTFNGVDMITTWISATQLTAAIPETAVAAAGSYPLQVRNSTGCLSNILTFTVAAPPAVWADDNWVGLAPGTVVSVTVPSSGNHTVGYDAFATVQAGIDAVADPGTEYVLPGTYQERLQISKGVNIRGPNADINPNTGSWGPEAILDSKSHGVALDFLKTGSSGTVLNGLTWRQEDAANIVLSKWSGINNVVIKDNWFDTNVSSAIQLEGGFSGSNWSILDNKVTTVTGGGPAFTLYNLTSSTVSGNSVANTASGILLTSVTGTQISNNTFSGIGGVNVQINTGCGNLTVDGNAVAGDGTTSTGVQLFGGLTGTVSVTHNVIHGCAAGVTVATGQNITGLDIHVNTNDLSSNAYGASNTGTGNLDATCNWWGSGMGPTHATNPYPGTGVPVTDGVTFSPWSTATPPLYNCDGQIRCMNPVFASATPLPNIEGAQDVQQILTVTNPAGSAVPASFAYAWQSGFIFHDFTAFPSGVPIGYWQEMRPYATPYLPSASYPILRIDITHAFVDVNGNGIDDGLGTDYAVSLDVGTRMITMTRTIPSGAVESQNAGYRLILQSPLVYNPEASADYTVTATLSSDCLAAWSGSAIENIVPPGSGCEPGALHDVGDTVRVTKSGSEFTIAWPSDPAPSDCMVGYGVYASTDCTRWTSFAPFASVGKTPLQDPKQVVAGTGVNLTFFLVAEVDDTGQTGPTGWNAPQ